MLNSAKNCEEAMKLFKQASDLGHPTAKLMLRIETEPVKDETSQIIGDRPLTPSVVLKRTSRASRLKAPNNNRQRSHSASHHV